MSDSRTTIKGKTFGRWVLGGLTAIWFLGLALRLYLLVRPGTFYDRLNHLFPGLFSWAAAILTFTLAVLWAGLLWSQRRSRVAPVPLLTPAEMLELDPDQFEKHVALLFKHKGFQVNHRGRSGDHGVDLEVLAPSGRLGIVQCKRYRSTVGELVVRDLYGTMLHEGAAHAYLVTAGEISSAARSWVDGKPITLVDGARLHHLIKELSR